METLFSILQGLALLLLLLALPGCGYLLIISLAGWRRLPASQQPPISGKLAILMPAHNESLIIKRSLRNVLPLAAQDGQTEVVVIADNCTDNTAHLAKQAGATVLKRQQPELRGKGYALDFALQQLADQGFSAYIILDADSVIADNFLSTIRQQLSDGSLALQTRYGVLNPEDCHHTRMAQLACAAFNVLRPRGRQRLGLSVGLLGNGLVLTHQLVQQFPYQARSIVEDLEYHLQLQLAGIKVKFVDQTEVQAEVPTSNDGRNSQHSRWQGGRLAMLKQYGFPLLNRIIHGEWRLLDALGELLLLPLSYQLALLLLALLLGHGWAMYLALTGLAIISVHVIIAGRIAGLSLTDFVRLGWPLPAYLWWKLKLIHHTLEHSKQHSPWVRTQRNH